MSRHHSDRRIRHFGLAGVATCLVGAMVALLPGTAAQADVGSGRLVVEQQGLDFGLVGVGDTSTPQVVSIRNAGVTVLSLTDIGTSAAPFARTATTCGATLVPGGSCTASYAFNPTDGGSAMGDATIASSGGSATVHLTGTGDLGGFPLAVAPGSFDFGDVAVGTSSGPQVLRITNVTSSSVEFQFAGGGMSGAVSNSTACGGVTHTLAPGASCDTNYVAKPEVLGSVTKSSSITLSVVGGDSKVVPVSATVNGFFPLVLSPVTMDFGAVPVGATSPTQTVTITNPTSSSVDFQFAGGGMSGAFSNATACGGITHTLAPGASCDTNYTFSPTEVGPASSTAGITLTMWRDGVATTASRNYPVTASGEGTFPLVLSPVNVDFGPVAVGSTSPTQTVTITNPTSSPISFQFSGGGMSGVFSNATACGGSPKTLAPGASCETNYAFSPTEEGPASKTSAITLTIYQGTDATTTSKNYPITATGYGSGAGPRLRVTPFALDFGPRAVGGSSTLVGRITNTGSAALTGIDVQPATGTGFTRTVSCATLAPGASCDVEVTFSPTAAGAASTSVSVQTDAGSRQVSATGVGVGIGATDDSYAATPGSPLVITDPGLGLLGNDLGVGLVVSSTTSPGQGTVVVHPDGTFTYEANASAGGTDTFSYTVTDDAGAIATATVSISLGTATTSTTSTSTTSTSTTTVPNTSTPASATSSGGTAAHPFGPEPSSAAGELPKTGSNPLPLTGAAVALLVVGGALIGSGRRRRRTC